MLDWNDTESYRELLAETASDPGFSMDAHTIATMSSEVIASQISASDTHVCPGVFDSHRLSGFCHCSARTGNIRGVVWGMYVAVDQRRSGIGTRLLIETLELASDRLDLEALELTTDSQNQVAIDLYRRHGFTYLKEESSASRRLITFELNLSGPGRF